MYLFQKQFKDKYVIQMYFIIKLLSDVYKYACVKEKKHPDLFSSTVFTVPLKDRILKTYTERSSCLQKKLYHQFSELYGEENCGLNIHNIGE